MESSSLERPTSRPIVPTVLSNLWQKAKPARPGVMYPSTPRKLGEPVDAYWHDRYFLEPYFVPGRGYDQYRPAYALGWKASLSPEHAQQDFESAEARLEERWEQERGGSLLHWNQVREAVEASWLQARRRTPAQPAASTLELQTTALLNAVLALGRQAHVRLGECMDPMPQGLIGQVLARHFNASQVLVDDLERAIDANGGVVLPVRDSRAALRRNAFWDGLLGREEGADYVLDQAESCQQQWLSAYEAAEQARLPRALSEILHRQSLMLRGHIEAIHWLRRYML
ncbi:hypothetical protein DR66_3205 [Delftia acidovorans]|uniref:DUF2383 domain-containing protein n=1 Tax=Delftia tsuruhatensis TaxID=180282 RepID=A0ABM6ECP7_9BURK|nr:hypothetical protein BI380_30275 [Delftia tsuruhatensis]KFJ12520.1 hypothetical protein DR66_3205 [Delftia acidovorans]QQB48719.1 hypothetical protein I6H54_20440 [Delftia acidovorans]